MPDLFAADHVLTRFLIQRSLAAVYLVAFLVAANQFVPLLGRRGLLPAPRFLERVGFRERPGLFHLHYSDAFARALAWTGVGLSGLALLGITEAFGTPVSMASWALLWLLYLSFVNVGQTFYGYGWESLLLETGFLAVFLGASGTAAPDVVVWLLRWVLFRVMFGAALIKLRGDSCWRELTCLRYHYETQPLPNPLSWYLHRSPEWLHKAGALFTHFVQLVVPFGYFLPAPGSWIAGGLTILFQGTLILSGNLSWLNWLTLVLAFSCFDDSALSAVLPLEPWVVEPMAPAHQIAVWTLLLLVAALSVRPVRNLLSSRQRMNASFDPLHLVNTYGAFGSVTRRRREVVVEGTRDRDPGPDSEWRAYEFKGKPGDPERRPPWVAPYHLRLDWQMWFAAMSPYPYHPWILTLAERLLEGDEGVLGLLAGNPFPDDPPATIRARLYHYAFTEPEEKRATGRWWRRSLEGEYLPPISLEGWAAGRAAWKGTASREGTATR